VPLLEEPTDYRFEDPAVKPPEVVVMTGSEPDEQGVINMVRAQPAQPTELVPVTGNYQLRNQFTYKNGMMYCTPIWVPEFPVPEVGQPQNPMLYSQLMPMYMSPFASLPVAPYNYVATCPMVPYWPAPCMLIPMEMGYWQRTLEQQNCQSDIHIVV